MLTLRPVSQFRPTRGVMPPRFLNILKLLLKYHGIYYFVHFNTFLASFIYAFFYETLEIQTNFLEIQNVINRYGIEQEYTLLQKDVKWPLGWPTGGFPGPQVIKLSHFPNQHFLPCFMYFANHH